MAEMDTSGGGGHKKGPGVKKTKKASTKVDLTPMVDLGFLLITFFIFTTTMSEPTSMRFNLPKDTDKPEEQNKAKESGALTLLLGKNDVIYYYEGQLKEDASNFLTSSFGKIRQVIIDKKKAVIAAHVHDEGCKKIQEKARLGDPTRGIKPDPNWQKACLDKDLVVVIKPDDEATYKNTIDILDEMAINDVKAFAVVDITPQENSLIKETEKNAGIQ